MTHRAEAFHPAVGAGALHADVFPFAVRASTLDASAEPGAGCVDCCSCGKLGPGSGGDDAGENEQRRAGVREVGQVVLVDFCIIRDTEEKLFQSPPSSSPMPK